MNREIAAYIDRLVALEKQKAAIVSDEADIKTEIKSAGYDAALIMKCVRLKLKDEQKRRKELDQIELFDTYLAAAGLIADRGEDAEPAPPPRREEAATGAHPQNVSITIGREAAPMLRKAAAEMRKPPADGSTIRFADGVTADVSIVPAGPKYSVAFVTETRGDPPALPTPEEDTPEFLRRPKPAAATVPA